MNIKIKPSSDDFKRNYRGLFVNLPIVVDFREIFVGFVGFFCLRVLSKVFAFYSGLLMILWGVAAGLWPVFFVDYSGFMWWMNWKDFGEFCWFFVDYGGFMWGCATAERIENQA